ncbi:hypothetical protein SAMN05216296_1642 [Pseudomonas pohangensis]|uniref:Uncharacterized protein n=1 Tax=Pseudomonas pohangensis TaxID=364197 RepID=A0A1H2FK86_9PSED|nr:hypothetical protein [Pseudomonas pohangensis]SDU07810.1 hypothetical protein SAMN05216296_1642 [Pseudomonas pohangensis]
MIKALLLGTALGVIAEIIAYSANLWKYHKTVSPLINSLCMFGLIMGSVSLLQPAIGPGAVFLIGFVIGYAYEWANFLLLDWWVFPDERLLIFRGRQACALALAVTWGLVPVIVAQLSSRLPI